MIRPQGAHAALLALASVAALAAWPASGGATVIDRGTSTESFSDDYADDCGRAVHEDFTITGRFHARVGKGDLTSAFFGHNNYSFTSRITNPANDHFFTIAGNFAFQETKAVPVSGTIFQFTAVEAGTWRLLDSSGRVVVFDRGNIRTTILFDTLGDDVPGGEFVDLVSELVHGPHQGFFLTEEEFCSLTDTLLG